MISRPLNHADSQEPAVLSRNDGVIMGLHFLFAIFIRALYHRVARCLRGIFKRCIVLLCINYRFKLLSTNDFAQLNGKRVRVLSRVFKF